MLVMGMTCLLWYLLVIAPLARDIVKIETQINTTIFCKRKNENCRSSCVLFYFEVGRKIIWYLSSGSEDELNLNDFTMEKKWRAR